MLTLIPLPDLKDDATTKGLLLNFFKGNALEKETLREYVLEQLLLLREKYQQSIVLSDASQTWSKVRDLAQLSKEQVSIGAVNQILLLPKYIDQLIQSSVKDEFAFELYIRTKAAEINSGDTVRDYFLSMKIRNDQLLASMYIYSEAYNNVVNCLGYQPHEILKHPSFIFFGEKSIEDRIYETAQQLYEARLRLSMI